VAETAGLLRQQEVLREFIESISSELELRPLLTRIVHHACELLAADYGTIGLVDESRNVVRTEATYRMPPDEMGAEMAPGVGLAGMVFETQRPVVQDRYGDVQRPTQPDLTDHAVVGMPIFWHDRMIGFFGIGAEPPRRFSARDVETLALFARHAAVAIENARRYEREQRRIERLALIARIGRIVTADLMLEDLLRRAGAAIHELLGYANVDVGLLLPDDPDTLVIIAVAGHFRELISHEVRVPVTRGIMGRAALQRRAVLVNDVQSDPEYIPMPGAPGISAELAVPIVLGERVLGVLNVEAGAPFDEEDAAGLQIIADQLAGAIENARLFSRVNTALQETRLLYESSQRINAAHDVDEVIVSYLELVAARGHYTCSVALYDLDAAGQRQAVVVRGRWSPRGGLRRATERHPYARDGLDPILDSGQTATISDVHTDPRVTEELRRIQRRAGRPALAMIPLMARGQRIGLVILSHDREHDWPEAALQPYQVTAAQLATAIDHRRQQRLLLERGQQVAVLEERQRLARELHDSVTQLVFSTALIAQSVGPAWRRDPAEGERRIDRLLDLSRSALAEMRALLFELRPPEDGGAADAPEDTRDAVSPGLVRVQRDGLAAALRQHVVGISSDGLVVEVEASGYRRQTLAHEEALYRIAQEAMNNVIKHSRARRATIRLTLDGRGVRLTVTDDGVGFRRPAGRRPAGRPGLPGTGDGTPAADDPPAGGFGLRTMRERAQALGGTADVRAAPGRGTIVDVYLPPASSVAEVR
jgi:signal transduction histidine kinase/putative methionine-R-sulfoxide reductase with GAF domain